MSITDSKPYGDSPEERARELIETGSSVRRHGKPIMTLICEALFPDGDEPAKEQTP